MSDNNRMAKAKDKIDWSVFARGAAGRSARIKSIKVSLKYIIALFTLSLVPGIMLWKGQKSVGTSWAITIAVIIWVVGKRLETKADEMSDPWLIGARGEGLVAETLQALESDDFRFIHDLPNGSGNIDHFAISRTGLFVIETKNWSGRIHYTDGKLCRNGWPPDKDPVKQVKKQALFLAEKVQPVLNRRLFVTPIVCFVRASIDPTASTIEKVHVTGLRLLRRHITNGKAVLSRAEVAEIRAAAEQWR